MIELNLVGVRVELPSNQPIVLLRERDGKRYLPIWIGFPEAQAIDLALRGTQTPRPITELRDGIFYAVLHMSRNGTRYEVSSRPSDAIALAVRTSVPIFASEEVLTEASIDVPDEDEQEVEKFREFLDQVRPEDFA